MKRQFNFANLNRKRTLILAGIPLITAIFAGILLRNNHFAFYNREGYNITFTKWCEGWFVDADPNLGALTVFFINQPAVPNHSFSKRTYLWYLRKAIPDAKVLSFLSDKGGTRFVIVKLPAPREVMVHCWDSEKGENFDYEVSAIHVENRTYQIPPGLSESIASGEYKIISMDSYSLTDTEFSIHSRSFLEHLGEKFEIPGNTPIRECSFHFNVSSGADSENGKEGQFVIAFDDEMQQWRIFERDWHEFEMINSWKKNRVERNN